MKNEFKVEIDKNLYYQHIKETIKEKVKNFLGEVDPSYLEEFTQIVERKVMDDISKLKDTEDYNLDAVSGYIDQSILKFMEAGQSKLQAGEAIRFELKNEANKSGKQTRLNEFNEAVAQDNKLSVQKKYDKFPFNKTISDELRGVFLLKTSKDDTFKGLMNEVDSLITKYMDQDNWNLIKKAMDEADKRVLDEDLLFLSPLKGRVQGKVRELTSEEKKKWCLSDETITVDQRKDNYDLVALKELVCILKGENVNKFTIGPGFFGKIMPELKENGIDSLIFHVEDKKLSAIYPMKSDVQLNGYGVTDAAVMYSSWSMYNRDNPKDFSSNERFYVLVNGAVGAPSDGKTLNYEEAAYNEIVIQSAEVFLYDKGDKFETPLKATRLYFIPYKPSLLNPYNQHGSVVFGTNDQTYHSCVGNSNWSPLNNVHNDVINEDSFGIFRNEWIKEIRKTNGECRLYPGFLSATLHAISEEDRKKHGYAYMTQLGEKQKEILKKAIRGIYEESTFLKNAYKIKYSSFLSIESKRVDSDKMNKEFNYSKFLRDTNYLYLVEKTRPLTKSFLVNFYVHLQEIFPENFKSFYEKLADKVSYQQDIEFLRNKKE